METGNSNSITKLKEKIAEIEIKLDECEDDTNKYCSLMRIYNASLKLLDSLENKKESDNSYMININITEMDKK